MHMCGEAFVMQAAFQEGIPNVSGSIQTNFVFFILSPLYYRETACTLLFINSHLTYIIIVGIGIWYLAVTWQVL